MKLNKNYMKIKQLINNIRKNETIENKLSFIYNLTTDYPQNKKYFLNVKKYKIIIEYYSHPLPDDISIHVAINNNIIFMFDVLYSNDFNKIIINYILNNDIIYNLDNILDHIVKYFPKIE